MIKYSRFFLLIISLLIIIKQVSTWCFKTHLSDSDRINSIDYSRDGTKFVTTSNSKRVIVWDARTFQVLKTYDFPVNPKIARFSNDGSMLAIGGQQDNIHVLRTSDYTPITTTFATGHGWVNDLDFNYNGENFIACGNTQNVKLWELTAPTTFTYRDSSNNVGSGVNIFTCRFAKFKSFIAYGQSEGDAYTSQYSNNNLWNSQRRSSQVSGTQRKALDWNHLRNTTFFGGTDKYLQILDTGANNQNRYNIAKQIDSISVAMDGTYVAFGGQGGLLYIYSLKTADAAFPEINFNQSTIPTVSRITATAMSPNSQFLISGNDQGMMYVYKRICNGCPSGTYANNTQCLSCSKSLPGCYLCRNSSYCLGCSNGYYLDTSSSTSRPCKPCFTQMTGCNQCSSNSVCISCVQGFYLDGSTCKPCWDVLKGCLMCSDANTCVQCDFRYYLNASSNKCVTCTNITNCLSCNSSVYCIDCVQGYYEDAGGCTICTKNCSNCENGTHCTQCDNSFYLTASGTCALCTVKGCVSCNSTNYCFDCIQSMYENSGSCSFCTPPCQECTGSGTSACISCIVGYYLNGNQCNSCTGILAECVACKGPTTATDCTACATGYYINGNTCSQCTGIIANCAQCNSTTCSVCKLGFWYDSTNTVCKLCPAGCISCTDATVCLSCQVGYYHTSPANTCTQCPLECSACESATVCYSCNPKYYFNSTNKNCTKCSVTNCITCKDSTTCLTCTQGYFLDSAGTICRACSNNITKCLDCYNHTYCKACQLGFYLTSTNASCNQCASPCSTCDDTDCFTCELGYFLTTVSPKKCSSCPKQCAQCVSATNCSKCNPGYYQNSATDQCLSCQNVKTGCQSCNDTVCFECKFQLGYFHNGTDNTCPLCSSKITNCENCLSQINCIICKYGYVLTSSNTTCTICSSQISNCEHCLNTADCQTCLKGFYVDANGDCQKCSQGCSGCNTSSNCQICLRQYVLEPNFSCKLCEDHIIGCQQCRYNPTIQCINCVTGYYIQGTSCTLCSSTLQGCTICNSSAICLSCASGYYHDPTNKCFLCSSNKPNCQLCQYNSGTTSVNCLSCNDGYFLSATFQCQTCTDVACLSCSDSTTCTRCQTGFYLSSGDCLKCQDLFTGCTMCNATDCLQCGSGFYLDGGNRCQACSLQGCEICSQLNPTTKCLSCNSQYYLTGAQTCELCRVPIPNCLQCANSLTCQQCQSGYFIDTNSKCSLCSSKFIGSTLCTPSVCLQCQSGYLLDITTNKCQLCMDYMPGCSFCLSQTTCLSCQSGYFSDTNTCKRCSTITGCLQCINATQCIFCDYGYYLKDDSCHLCNQTIQNCVACASSVMCTACLGNYILSAGSCNQLKGESFPNYTEIKLITQYISATQLKHTLQSVGKKITKMDLDFTKQSKLYILDENYTDHALTIKRYEFSPNGFSLVFYTDNPLGNLDQVNSMPLLGSRRLLAGVSMSNKLKTKIQMTEEGVNSLFPDVHHTGTFYMKYKLSQPQFYRSVVTTKTYYYHYFGSIISVLLVILYFCKSMIFVPEAIDKGQIIPHILCFKMMSFIIYPLFGQYLNYCQGFLLLDFPWFNDFFSPLMTIDTDISPEPYKIFYFNLNLPSQYLLALIIITTIYVLGYLFIKLIMKNQTHWDNFRSLLYNVFICGLVVGSFLSLLGAYYNPVQKISVNSLFYILGVSIFVAIVLESVYSIYKAVSNTVIPFHKVRIIIKCVALSLAYVNPVYIFMSLIFLDLCLLVIEYLLKRDKKVTPKLWLFNNILIDAGLCMMMLGPYSLISIFIASGCILAVIGIEIFIMIKENSQMKQIRKVKLQEHELIKTMQALQKEHQSARNKNHQIYFKNKILQDLQSQKGTSIQKKNQNQAMNNSQSLFFEQNEDQANQQFNTGPIAQQQQQNTSDNQQIRMPQIAPSKKRTVKTSLRNKKKQQKKQWSIQEQNQGTFVLGDFE